MTITSEQAQALLKLAQDAIESEETQRRMAGYHQDEMTRYKGWWHDECSKTATLTAEIEELKVQVDHLKLMAGKEVEA